MRNITYWAAALCVALGLVVWYGDTIFAKKNQALLLYELDASQVLQVEVVKPIEHRWMCQRQENSPWKMIQPTVQDVDASEMANFVRYAARVEIGRKLTESSTDLSMFGLSPPEWVVKVAVKGGASKTLEIGRKTPDDRSFYLRETSNPTLYTALAWGIAPLLKKPSDLRRPHPPKKSK